MENKLKSSSLVVIFAMISSMPWLALSMSVNNDSGSKLIVSDVDKLINKNSSPNSKIMAKETILLAQADISVATRNAAVGKCMASAKFTQKTGNPVIDSRCSLVAFEVCMNKETGIISQSQGTTKQCTIMKGLGGATACLQPCAEALALPVGGKGAVDRYTGLTPAAVSCYNGVMDRLTDGDESENACNANVAMQCLMNGSSSPVVNAAILRDRKGECQSFYKRYPGKACVACFKDNLRVDYDPLKIDLDSKYCTPALAAAKQCTMPGAGLN
jgi:hypothetical protein